MQRLRVSSARVIAILPALLLSLAACATQPTSSAAPNRITTSCGFAKCELERIGPEQYRLQLAEMSGLEPRAIERLSLLATASAARHLSREYFAVSAEYWAGADGTRLDPRGALTPGLARVIEFTVYATPPAASRRVHSVQETLGQATPRYEVDASPDALRMQRAKTAALLLLFVLAGGGVSRR